MRLPISYKGKNNEFTNFVNDIYHDIKDNFEKSVKMNLETSKIKVMLGDFSITETDTFDVNRALNYFINKEKEIASLKRWEVVPVQSTKTDDLHRISLHMSIEIGKYYFSIDLGIQFHSLLYYIPDKHVIALNKKIRELEENSFSIKKEVSLKGDQIIGQELAKLGYKDIGNTELFEELFAKQDLSKNLADKASEIEDSFPELKQNTALIENLKQELESFIIEVYQINSASIDPNKLMMGEEGIAFSMDFELIKNKKTAEKTSVINFENFNKSEISKIEQDLLDVTTVFKGQS